MNLGKKSTFLLSGGLLLALGLGIAASGCGQCAAACVSGLGFKGDLAVNVADKPALSIKACYESDCRTASLTFDDQGIASCNQGLECQLSANQDGTSHLEVTMFDPDATLKEGGKASIHIEKSADNTVLVDKQAPLDAVDEGEICGQTCEGGSISWSP